MVIEQLAVVAAPAVSVTWAVMIVDPGAGARVDQGRG